MNDGLEKRRISLAAWAGTAALVIGLGTTCYNLASSWLERQRAHAVEDKVRDDERAAMSKRMDAQDARVRRLANRVGVLEGIDYKTLSKEYALEIYYANSNTPNPD